MYTADSIGLISRFQENESGFGMIFLYEKERNKREMEDLYNAEHDSEDYKRYCKKCEYFADQEKPVCIRGERQSPQKDDEACDYFMKTFVGGMSTRELEGEYYMGLLPYD